MNEKLLLLVEDDHKSELQTIDALTKGQMINQTAIVRDGQDALDYLFYQGKYNTREGGNPQLILLNLKVSKVDGLEILERIRREESTRNISVIFLISSKNEKNVVPIYGHGFTSYLIKPIDLSQLDQVIQECLSYWANLNFKM